MSWVRGALALLACLAVQVILGRVAPGAHRYVDTLLLPLAWYGLRGEQRSAMFAGCAGGLVRDVWFEPVLFGISGFAKTLLGWALGGLGARFDLNATWARAAVGFLLPGLEQLVTSGLRGLFDQEMAPFSWLELLVRSVISGLLVSFVFAILIRVRHGRGGVPHGRRLG